MGDSIAKRMFWSAVTSPTTWLPVLGGIGLAATTGGVWFGVGIAAVAVGVGSAVWQLTLGKRSTAEKVIAEIKKESNRAHYDSLRKLQRKLRRDKDPLTGKLLRQLRETHKRMDQMGILTGFRAPQWKADIKTKVLDLYESSVKSLENTFDVWNKAQQVSSEESKTTLLENRAKILSEVESSTTHLGKTLDQLQVSDVKTEEPENALAELRLELDRGLEVAKRVEERISELDQKIRIATKAPIP